MWVSIRCVDMAVIIDGTDGVLRASRRGQCTYFGVPVSTASLKGT